ncbi:hypothetical protein PILCRDRAFT_663774 [Piloderma croceum F 1598]|uniref:Uncharacterized protein n=1 Tax=Piloderma croceum (strain F 1598) TaxID=765440 RepID=A0A0C3BEL6_PILCF|nr:hypothetical protein PILCRDRAFT_663774 [Piloderma croceum F 1598]
MSNLTSQFYRLFLFCVCPSFEPHTRHASIKNIESGHWHLHVVTLRREAYTQSIRVGIIFYGRKVDKRMKSYVAPYLLGTKHQNVRTET